MAINENEVASLVAKVLAEMTGKAPAAPSRAAAPAPCAARGGVPKTARVAMLTDLKHFELKEYPIP